MEKPQHSILITKRSALFLINTNSCIYELYLMIKKAFDFAQMHDRMVKTNALKIRNFKISHHLNNPKNLLI